jgi:CubicO group peptidase (beta-lactamase class C family)
MPMPITARQAEDAVEAEHAREPFTGVVSIATTDEVFVRRAFGMADRANGRANTPDTRFGIASGTKIMTAVAALSLVDAGRLALDARLADVVSAPLPHFDSSITIAQLLSHTAGNPDYFDEETQDDYAALWAERPTHTMRRPADFLPMFADLPQKFPPGERFAYSNAGFILLGLAVEAASGEAYADYVAEHVLAPAGMTDSGFFALDDLPARVALGYLDATSNRTNAFSVPVVGGPDGGMFTTAEDLERFWRALVAGRLLTPETTATMLAPRATTGADQPTERYGLGVWIGGSGDELRYVIVGEDPGASMVSAIEPATGLVLSVLGNTDSAAWPMHAALRAAIAATG